ncbi:MAG: FGGY family carbohydrate kinase [Spirochaetota bacterium]
MAKSVAVFDLGMTNKKAAVYDLDLRVVESRSRVFEPILIDGIEAHDLVGIEEWLLDSLREFSRDNEIGAIGVSTHGATLVCVGADGLPCVPCVYYTHEPGPDFHARFYRMAGRRDTLQKETGTAGLSALVNPAKGLLFLKERFPELFDKTVHVLNYAQYWGYRLTGLAGADCTCTGVHTYLWDWRKEEYSSVARKLGVASKLPLPIRAPWEVLGPLKDELSLRCGLSGNARVTMGIHDSNSSLLPHLLKSEGRDFVLNSTGTWCVLMHPQERYGFSVDELGKLVFFNRSAFNRPVKTAIFPGGLEYEAWSSLIMSTAGSPNDFPLRSGTLPMEIYRKILIECKDFLLPEIIPGVGQFSGSMGRIVAGSVMLEPARLESGRYSLPAHCNCLWSMALLNLSLVIQTCVALRRVGLVAGTRVFTEGGFRHNEDYIRLLSAVLPENPVFVSDIAEASLFGCAITAVAALSGIDPAGVSGRFNIDYRRIEPIGALEGFARYCDSFIERTSGEPFVS